MKSTCAVPAAEAVQPPFGLGLRPDIPLSAINGGLVPFHALQIADFVDAVQEGRGPRSPGGRGDPSPSSPRSTPPRSPGARSGADPRVHLMNTPIGIAHLALLACRRPSS